MMNEFTQLAKNLTETLADIELARERFADVPEDIETAQELIASAIVMMNTAGDALAACDGKADDVEVNYKTLRDALQWLHGCTLNERQIGANILDTIRHPTNVSPLVRTVAAFTESEGKQPTKELLEKYVLVKPVEL